MTNSTFTSHSCVEPISTSSRRITLPPTLPMSSAPARHMPMTGLMEYALTTGISSTGMAACVTSAVSTFRRIARRALFINLFAQTASDYPQPRQRQPHYVPCRPIDSNIRWTHEGPYVSVFPTRVPGALKTRIYIGIYDTSYLSHLCAVLSLSPHYGLTAFVPLHQDVWSRYAGGYGAPPCTLE